MEPITRIEINLEEVADLLQGLGREPKLVPNRDIKAWHVTNLLESAQLIASGSTKYYEFEGEPSGIMSMGRIWEHAADVWLAEIAKSVIGPGAVYVPDVEMIKDGVVASLDGLLVSERLVVSETKLRFTADPLLPMRHRQQVACYCKIASTNLVAFTTLRITSRPPTANADFVVWRLTQTEINETWSLILNTKKCLEDKGIRPNQGGFNGN